MHKSLCLNRNFYGHRGEIKFAKQQLFYIRLDHYLHFADCFKFCRLEDHHTCTSKEQRRCGWKSEVMRLKLWKSWEVAVWSMIGALRPTTSGWLVRTTIGRRIGAGFHPQHGKEFMFSSILAGNWVWRQGDRGWVQRHGREFKFDSGSLLRIPQSVLGGNLSFNSSW